MKHWWVWWWMLATALNGYGQYSTQFIVALDGSGDFTSIQEAIRHCKAFPDKEITIFIKNGTYNEKVTIPSWNPHLLLEGESRDSTIIVWDDHFGKINQGRNSTFLTHTLRIDANDITIRNLTIRNNAGPVGQAVALHLEGDRIALINCSILGHQDTVYGAGARQWFKNCFISGTTDFIFGGATLVFSNCTIHSLGNSYIVAASTPPDVPFGMVFLDCQLTADENVNAVFLGRPWRPFAQTAFIRCRLGQHIHPQGWDNWRNPENERTARYAEFGNNGPGADTRQRVDWARQLTKKKASKYTVENIFGDWRPEVK